MEPSLRIVAVGSISPNYEYPKRAYSRKVRGRLAEALFYFLRGSSFFAACAASSDGRGQIRATNQGSVNDQLSRLP